MPTYLWKSRKLKAKQHIEANDGKTWCQAENNMRKLFDRRSETPDEHRQICQNCTIKSDSYKALSASEQNKFWKRRGGKKQRHDYRRLPLWREPDLRVLMGEKIAG